MDVNERTTTATTTQSRTWGPRRMVKSGKWVSICGSPNLRHFPSTRSIYSSIRLHTFRYNITQSIGESVIRNCSSETFVQFYAAVLEKWELLSNTLSFKCTAAFIKYFLFPPNTRDSHFILWMCIQNGNQISGIAKWQNVMVNVLYAVLGPGTPGWRRLFRRFCSFGIV